jgi:phenylacetate-CoA ligase
VIGGEAEAANEEKRMFQPDLESMPREKLADLQLARLRESIGRIAASNPAYHERLGGVQADDIKSLDDLGELPFMTKDDLRDGYPYGYACAPQESFVRMQMSSGTTGTPIICPHTEADVDQWGEIMARCLAAAGLTSSDVIQITPSFGLFNGGFGFHYGASKLKTMIIPIGAGRTGLQLRFMKELGTTALAAIASYPLRLMEVAREEGFDFRRDSKLRAGIFGAETWSDELRARIEDDMGIQTFDIIGMTETAGVGMGIDCEVHEGVHVWEDHYLVEIVNMDTGEPVPDGEMGEMIVTTLTREGLPLVRYRTRDLTAVASREPCDCGRTHLRVERIATRTDEMFKVKGVNFYSKQVESILLEHEGVATDYKVIIDREEGKDTMAIEVEVENPDQPDLAESIGRQLTDMLGLNADIRIVPMGSIERPPGKAVRVEDRRKPL